MISFPKYFLFLYFSIIFFVVSVDASEFGDIQITCEEGIDVWIDGDFQGKTNSEENGLFIENISSGNHTIKAVKKGFVSEVKKINAVSGVTVEVILNFKKSSIEIENITNNYKATFIQEVGSFCLRSIPLHAEIFLNGDSIGTTEKKYLVFR